MTMGRRAPNIWRNRTIMWRRMMLVIEKMGMMWKRTRTAGRRASTKGREVMLWRRAMLWRRMFFWRRRTDRRRKAMMTVIFFMIVDQIRPMISMILVVDYGSILLLRRMNLI